ncbi:GNAT family N-acetyltransferase [Pseudactinotalea sp. Z1739]|uniref:GNAT family N-acetyltransferase n=1 Tax=Pseudactinotalea sp. Z1739 TaxID=3413028 RepID=UPI003C7DB56C
MADPQISHSSDQQQFVATAGGEHLGRLEYERRADVVALRHTLVEPAAEGRGVGSALARTALDWIRAEGRRVDPVCPFVAAWIERHPDYADLVVSEGS